MSKFIVSLVLLLLLASCSYLHDGSGWEHNMDDSSDAILEHVH
ncbi:hypothetical protein [Ghiorsea bivora]|nr:hypothetical protein [Ghiorsea bivora]